MLKARAILDTLAEGSERGTFVLRLVRPDGTARTWWMTRPDETALNDPALELVLPEAGELMELPPALLAPKRLPELWAADEITVRDVKSYFASGKVVRIDRGGYPESIAIPKVGAGALEKGIVGAVENGTLWLLSGPASLLAEEIPAGVLTESAKLCPPPPGISAAEVLPENLPAAWKDDETSGLSVGTALSVKMGRVLPWKTVRDAVSGAVQARFLQVAEDSVPWPCEFPSARSAKFKVAKAAADGPGSAGESGAPPLKLLVASVDLEPSEIQELGDVVPKLLKLKARTNIPFRFHVRIEMGDGKTLPPAELAKEANAILEAVKEGLRLR